MPHIASGGVTNDLIHELPEALLHNNGLTLLLVTLVRLGQACSHIPEHRACPSCYSEGANTQRRDNWPQEAEVFCHLKDLW